jgi:hypothetical protein
MSPLLVAAYLDFLKATCSVSVEFPVSAVLSGANILRVNTAFAGRLTSADICSVLLHPTQSFRPFWPMYPARISLSLSTIYLSLARGNLVLKAL